MSNPLVGQTLGHYRILDQLGAGGMGVVYRAQDLTLGRQVAVKVLPAGSAANEEAVERFRREARTASALNHPNICTIYGFDEHEGQLYLAMELLDGEPLDRKLSGRPLDLKLTLDIATQVAEALDAAHTEGILHRDVKPANILITRRGQVKVLDFGLAKLAPGYRRSGRDVDARLDTRVAEHFTSVAGTTVGTIAYMSPEQARGDDVDPRTDLFSFGVVLYEMLTGRQSFPGHTTAVVFDGILNREPAPPSSLNASLPPELDRIIGKALEKDRALRYQTAADLGADVKRLRRDFSSRQATPSSAPVPPSISRPAAAPETNVLPPGDAAASNAPSQPSLLESAGSRAMSAARQPAVLAGAGIAVAAVIAIAAGAYFATRSGGDNPGTPTQSASPQVPPLADIPAAKPEPPPAGPTSTAPVATVASDPKPESATSNASSTLTPKPAPPRTSASKPAVKTAPPAASAPATAPASPREAEAAQKLEVARAKIANHLTDQAVGDLRQIVVDYPGSRTAAEAALLAADVLEKNGKLDDAMAAYVEFESRFAADGRVADAKLSRAGILAKNRAPRAQLQSRELYGEVARNYPGTPQANQALQAKLRIENDRKELREMDPVMKIEVPAIIVTLRMLIDQFPDTPQSMPARNRLAMLLTGMDRHQEAARVLEDLAARFPDNPMEVWFRLGELYDRRLNDPLRAKEAYAKVPPNSQRYQEAQKRSKRL